MFQVLHDLPFPATNHITNSYNENKPVKISRDTQELDLHAGEALMRLFDEAVGYQHSKPGLMPRGNTLNKSDTREKSPVKAGIGRSTSRSRSSDRGKRGLRRSKSPEWDILNMSYEEYVENVRVCIEQGKNFPVPPGFRQRMMAPPPVVPMAGPQYVMFRGPPPPPSFAPPPPVYGMAPMGYGGPPPPQQMFNGGMMPMRGMPNSFPPENRGRGRRGRGSRR